MLGTEAIIHGLNVGAIVCDPAPTRIEGTHIDITLGQHAWLWSPLRGAQTLRLRNADPADWFVRHDARDGEIELPPYGFILAHTEEFIGTAPGSGLVPTLHTRSTLARWGLSVCTANAGMGDPDWASRWTLEITNPHAETVYLPVGGRIGAISFDRVEGAAASYAPGTRYNATPQDWTPESLLPRRGNW